MAMMVVVGGCMVEGGSQRPRRPVVPRTWLCWGGGSWLLAAGSAGCCLVSSSTTVVGATSSEEVVVVYCAPPRTAPLPSSAQYSLRPPPLV